MNHRYSKSHLFQIVYAKCGNERDEYRRERDDDASVLIKNDSATQKVLLLIRIGVQRLLHFWGKIIAGAEVRRLIQTYIEDQKTEEAASDQVNRPKQFYLPRIHQ